MYECMYVCMCLCTCVYVILRLWLIDGQIMTARALSSAFSFSSAVVVVVVVVVVVCMGVGSRYIYTCLWFPITTEDVVFHNRLWLWKIKW